MERDTLLDPIRADQGFQALLAVLRADYASSRTRYEAVARMP
jgi:hypothetical protein